MCGERRGVAAFEFAIIGTPLLAATLGFFETALVVRAKSLLSSTVHNAAALGSTGALTLASPLVPNAGDSVIVIQASYAYVPVISTLRSSVTLKQIAFSQPKAGTVACIGG